ncbi:MAG TPA: hypothetical protein PKD09_24895 [Aggregatilinea sp.]|uniref:hypothetical protein n=1 Tax=Aggregatilinea sp. TaxID=2806333 RepID=UPI002BDAFDF9|nr:hypothetical protein [Aggregatilinea sp.]HML24916.1 hypothetical protein [Aggregatilinea sp.]
MADGIGQAGEEAPVVEIAVEKAAINPARLQEELAAALGEGYVGLSTGGKPGAVRVFLRDKADTERARGLVAAHDAAKLSTDQQKEADRAAVIKQLRGKAWAAWTAQDKEEALRILAERLLDGA